MRNRFAYALGAVLLATCTPLHADAQNAGEATSNPKSRAQTAETAEPDGTGEILRETFEELLKEEVLAALVAEFSKEAGAVGEAEPGWNTQGVYLPDVLTMGGSPLEKQILVEATGSVSSITRFGGENIAFPDGYLAYELGEFGEGDGPEDALEEHAAIGIGTGLWIVTRGFSERVDNASCTVGSFEMAIWMDRPVEDFSDEELGFLVVLYGGMLEFAKRDICVVYTSNEDGTFSSKAFTRSGEPYSALNAETDVQSLRPASQSAKIIATTIIPSPFGEAAEDSFAPDIES